MLLPYFHESFVELKLLKCLVLRRMPRSLHLNDNKITAYPDELLMYEIYIYIYIYGICLPYTIVYLFTFPCHEYHCNTVSLTLFRTRYFFINGSSYQVTLYDSTYFGRITIYFFLLFRF
jgi:hypothetical protein